MEENMTPEIVENEKLDVPAEEISVEEVASEEAVETTDLSYEITSDGEMSGRTEQERRRAEIIDNITTWLLILLLISPFAILLYILLWFIPS